MDRVRARQPFERSRELDDLAGDGILGDGAGKLGAGLERFVERLPRAFRHELRDPVDDAIRDLEHAPRVAKRGAGRHLRERDDLGDAVAPVLLCDVVDDALAALDGEVDVHVGHVLAGGIEEALEQEPVPERVDVRDLEAVGGERAGGGAATGPDRDTVPLGEADEVRDDQEVVRKPHLADRPELEAETLVELRRRRPVAPDEALLAELDEVVERVAPVRDREPRQADPPELQLDVAPLGDLEAALHRSLVTREVERHLRGGLEVELVGAEAPAIRVLQRVARLDAEERLVARGVRRVEVVDVAGRDERQPTALGERRQPVERSLLDVEADVLELDVGRVASEDLREPVELRVGVAVTVLRERPRDASGEAAGERDQPRRVALQELPVDPRLVVVPLEVAERAELDEVAVADVALREQRQVRVPLRLSAAGRRRRTPRSRRSA